MIILTHIIYSEIPYLDEWINFHRAQGFTTFYIYLKYGKLTYGSVIRKNNEIYDKLVKKYNNSNIYIIHIKSVPMIHINHFFKHIARLHIGEWCAILDIDEFIHTPKQGYTIKQITEEYENKAIDYILVNWVCYGSNGIVNNPKFEVINQFTKPTNRFHGINFTGKSFIRINTSIIDRDKITNNTHKLTLGPYYTSNGIKVSEHNKKNSKQLRIKRQAYLKGIGKKKGFPFYVYPEQNPNLLINHYITRSVTEYKRKILLNKKKRGRYNMVFFNYVNKI